MLLWAFVSLTLAVVSALLGFGASGVAAAEVCQVLAVVFLVLFVAAILSHSTQQTPTRR